MPIEHTALHPARGPGDGLTGEYFNSRDTERSLCSHAPTATSISTGTRSSPSVASGGTTTPSAGLAPSHRPRPGDYKLGVRVNYCYACENAEGFRLYLDGKVLVESGAKGTGERGAVIEAPVHFDDAKPHPIRLEYLHGAGSAGIDLTWHAPAAALRDEAVQAAKQSDVIIAFVGLSPSLEGEEMPVKLEGFSGGDRTGDRSSRCAGGAPEGAWPPPASRWSSSCRTAAPSPSIGPRSTPTPYSRPGIPERRAGQLSQKRSPAITTRPDVSH